MHQAENVGSWYFMLCNAGCICNFQEHFFFSLCIGEAGERSLSGGSP